MSTKPLNTQEELNKYREAMIQELRRHNEHHSEITCDDCSAKFECEFAYDTYNTNGDCLASK